MITPDTRNAIYTLYLKGMGKREIARRLNLSVNSVRRIINQRGVMPKIHRKDKTVIDSELLRHLYDQCNGWKQRIHERLTEEHGIDVGYSTLTRHLRELGLSSHKNDRCDKRPDVPGEEMQHDTTIHNVNLGDKRVRLVCSVLYFRYSKIRYMKYYPCFNRFTMKCFLDEALKFWGYAASTCIIDNTNLARLSGIGKTAVIVPEMIAFAKQYGFAFMCHERGHANRKAGNERSFYTVESNFLPGRTFRDYDDLNKQALTWATERKPNRPVGKTRLVPIHLFNQEKPWLTQVHSWTPSPFLVHERKVDQYGYISFNGNFYHIPGTSRFRVRVIEYSEKISVYYHREPLAEYPLPGPWVKNKPFSPEGRLPPHRRPHNRRKPTTDEENHLCRLDDDVAAYLSEFSTMHGKKKHASIRKLFALHKKLALPLFIKTIKRAHKYRVYDMDSVEQIAGMLMRTQSHEIPAVTIDDTCNTRSSYQAGQFADCVDLSVFDDQEGVHE